MPAFRRSSVGRQLAPGVASDLFVDVNLLNNWKQAVDGLYGSLRSVLEAPIDQTELDRVIAQLDAAVKGRPTDPMAELLADYLEKGELGPSAARAILEQHRKEIKKAKEK